MHHFKPKFHAKGRENRVVKAGPGKRKLIDEEIANLKSRYEEIDSSNVKNFSDFPLSKKTLEGLKNAEYTVPTDIQTESVGLILQGHDVLGAAKTGSGKTLSFLIPALEILYREKWSALDGLGVLIISPTRELAYQTYDVLRKIGNKHDFSAGLVIGGKHLKEEVGRINRTNVVICTPGRLLQHMDETVNFNADNLQLLVLDEADRILDLGFQETMNAVIENLPTTRQTVLFSATQTKSVKDLARLSLNDPMYISVHENAEHSTPTRLQQSYIVCELREKVDLLWSFLKNHMKCKILVFFQSCKQVRFIHETFRKLRPGITVLALHGGMHQLKRVATYDQFCRKQFAVLFATDIAARGLDFPAVNWVFQYDCPEDANTYIHRAGRTARYEKNGEALLLLTPTEEPAMIEQLKFKKIPIEKIKINPKKIWSIKAKLESMLASELPLKETAQRAFVSYLRSVFLMKNKAVFDVYKIDANAFSSSLGLAIAPRVRFLQRHLQQKQQQKLKKMAEKPVPDVQTRIGDEDNDDDSSSDDDSSDDHSSEDEKRLKTLKEEDSGTFDFAVDDCADLFTVKRVPRDIIDIDDDEGDGDDNNKLKDTKNKKDKKSQSKFQVAKKLLKKKIVVNSKIVFDEEGEKVIDEFRQQKDEGDDQNEGGLDINEAKQRMLQEDQVDKQIFRQRIKQKHLEEKIKRNAKKKKKKLKDADLSDEEEQEAVLGNPADDEAEESDENDQSGEDSVDDDENNGSDDDASGDDDESGDNDGSGDEISDEDRPQKRLRLADDVDDDGEDVNEENDSSGDDSEPMDTGLALADDEELALKLLQT